MSDDHATSIASVKPVERPLHLIPVGLKEAALDSPTFRATALHFSDQMQLVEQWLESYIKAASKLVSEVAQFETAVNSFLAAAAPPAAVSEAVLDHDYTLLAIRRYGEGAREFWGQSATAAKRLEALAVEPVRAFLHGELRGFREARRGLEGAQKSFDAVVGRYLAQGKAKEASALREDAFQLHEARKAYLKASMDFCVAAPQLRASLDALLVKVFAEQFRETRGGQDAVAVIFRRLGGEMDRVRGWSREMEHSERAFKRELVAARKQIEDSAVQMTRPSRELADYETAMPSYVSANMASSATPGQQEVRGEKQGWLFLKTLVGKPTRTVWSRRWFFIRHGIFGWLVQGSRSGGVEESEKIGVLLCSVKPAFQEERRFCFEVKTKDSSIILQAETPPELVEWIRAFEAAKRKALEDPASTQQDESVSSATISPGGDLAFAISPPVAPEFAARVGDGHGERGEEAQPMGLGVPREDTGLSLAQRASFDVSSGRRVTSLEKEPGEGSRDHATRIMQKLDLHKRSQPSSQLNQTSVPNTGGAGAGGGIASLISASHNILPVGPGAPPSTSIDGPKRNFSMPAKSTLAPSTLANPPAPTNLSHTAVVVSGERGIGLGGRGDGSGMPGGIMANLWGSNHWGYVNRLGDDPKPAQQQRSASSATVVPDMKSGSVDDVGVMDGMSQEVEKQMTPLPPTVPAGPKHRKTMTVGATSDMNLPLQNNAKSGLDDGGDEFPSCYPLPLKAQHAQFQMLFPSVPRKEKVVLVFRATWNPNEQQEFPGRVYVTTREIYFYSHHLGLVLITGVSLTSVAEVTSAPGRDCDFVYLHLKENRWSQNDTRRRITVRVFLDSLKLLQRRLDFLVQNANSEESSATLEEVVKRLIAMEVEEPPKRSSSVESWEDLTYDADELTGDGESPRRQRERNVKASLRIDGSLSYGGNAATATKTGREVQRFQLPRQPVVYAPQGMQTNVIREFNVSAKALFHVMFGDKSAVFQLLYCNRWADRIVQTPWTKASPPSVGAGPGAVAGGRWMRQFTSMGQATPLNDTQTIDILNDHLCYVVTNTKHPWRLPYARRFGLTTKYVITHHAKSRCKLAIFQNITWIQPPRLRYIRTLIEKQALNSLEADALDLTNVAMDQVTKLGNSSKTNKAIDIFGNVGQATTVPVIDTSAVPNLRGSAAAMRVRARKPVGLLGLVASDVTVQILGMLSMMFDVLVAICKGLIGLCTAHTLLVVVCMASVTWNSWFGYRDGLDWWRERCAVGYMARMGVKPDPVLSRAVYLADLEDIVVPLWEGANGTMNTMMGWSERSDEDEQSGKTCRSTFSDHLIMSTSSSTSGRTTSTELSGTGVRLRRSRDALAKYRHNLLVALRVVNRVEQDVVLAEWEDWVREEERKCAEVEGMLMRRRRRKLRAGTQTGENAKDEMRSEVLKPEDLDNELGHEFAEYCASCRREVAG